MKERTKFKKRKTAKKTKKLEKWVQRWGIQQGRRRRESAYRGKMRQEGGSGTREARNQWREWRKEIRE
jgi:hypothetical protein